MASFSTTTTSPARKLTRPAYFSSYLRSSERAPTTPADLPASTAALPSTSLRGITPKALAFRVFAALIRAVIERRSLTTKDVIHLPKTAEEAFEYAGGDLNSWVSLPRC